MQQLFYSFSEYTSHQDQKDIFNILLEAELNKVNKFYVQELKVLCRLFDLLTEQVVSRPVVLSLNSDRKE